MFLRLVLISMWLVSSHAFVRAPAQLIHSDMNRLQRSTRGSKSKLDLFLTPQIGFAAACAGAVFAYVYSNIDSIKEVQKVNIDKAMSQQAISLKSAEDGQKAALEKVKAQQEANLQRARQVAIDAKQRADDIGKEAAKRR